MPDNKEMRNKLLNYSYIKNDLRTWELSWLEEPYRSEYTAFIDKAILWEEVSGKEALEMVRCHLREGPDYAKRLKKGLTASFISYHKNTMDESRKDDMNTKAYSDLFPFSHLPYLKPDKIDDWKWYFREMEEIPLDEQSYFKTTLREILREIKGFKPYAPSRLNILNKIRAVSGYDKDDKILGVTRLKHPTVNPRRDCLKGVRSPVFVSPGNERDTVKWELRSLETIQIVSELIWQILDRIPESSMKDDRSSMEIREERLRKIGADRSTYNRDFKKCGLSFNQDIFRLMKEVLVEEYPEQEFYLIEAFENILIDFGFDDPEYFIKKGEHRRVNCGYGLGSASELVTLAQIVLYRMSKKRIGYKEQKIYATFWHDDAMIVGEYDIIKAFEKEDKRRCEAFCLPLKEELTGRIFGGCIFMEEYTSTRKWDTSKEILTLLALRDGRYRRNITAAKMSVQSMARDIYNSSDRVMEEYMSLVAYWGYEFCPEEAEMPFNFGGWLPVDDPIYDDTLNYIFDMEDRPDLETLYRLRAAGMTSFNIKPINRYKEMTKGIKQPSMMIVEGQWMIKEINAKFKNFDVDILQWNVERLGKKLGQAMTMRMVPNEAWDRFYLQRREQWKKHFDYRNLSEADLASKYLAEVYPKICKIPKQFVEEFADNIEYVGHSLSLSTPLYHELKTYNSGELLLSYLAKTEKGVSGPELEYENDGLALSLLDGHLMHMVFAQKMPIKRAIDMDKRLSRYTYLPLLYSSVCDWEGGVPKKISDDLIIPEIPFSPEIDGMPIDLNRIYASPWDREDTLRLLKKLVFRDELTLEENLENLWEYAGVVQTVDIKLPTELRELSTLDTYTIATKIIQYNLETKEKAKEEERRTLPGTEEPGTWTFRLSDIGIPQDLDFGPDGSLLSAPKYVTKAILDDIDLDMYLATDEEESEPEAEEEPDPPEEETNLFGMDTEGIDDWDEWMAQQQAEIDGDEEEHSSNDDDYESGSVESEISFDEPI